MHSLNPELVTQGMAAVCPPGDPEEGILWALSFLGEAVGRDGRRKGGCSGALPS